MTALSLLSKTLLAIENAEEMENVLTGLFTPAEIEEFAQRIKIFKMLKEKVPQRTIAQELGVGVATVSRGARELKEGNYKYV